MERLSAMRRSGPAAGSGREKANFSRDAMARSHKWTRETCLIASLYLQRNQQILWIYQGTISDNTICLTNTTYLLVVIYLLSRQIHCLRDVLKMQKMSKERFDMC